MAKGAKIIKFESVETFTEITKKAVELYRESGGEVVYLPFVKGEPNRWRQILEAKTPGDIRRAYGH